jgi:outer membrane receptor protein involved in Fe transport
MSRSRLFIALLLAGTGLSSHPALAQQDGSAAPQSLPPSGEDVAEPVSPAEDQADVAEDVDVSTPGGDGPEIIVTGRFIPEPVRNTAQVVSVLSAAEIARTGEGDIAGALQRVTGLSVTTGGFVYVRGLGDRYSLALLNGLALPSPEPLRRVVPLDIFPTSIVSSALVQKSYSVNFPGEYGGGVINLTTAELPDENFLTLGAGISGDSITTLNLGYTYFGGDYDRFGFDDGTRDTPLALVNNNGELVSANVLDNDDTLILQRNYDIPANGSFSGSGGYGADIGDVRFGLLASGSFSNAWQTRGVTQQTALAGSLVNSSYGVRTENRIQSSALLSLGFDLPEGHQLRFTNVYIHDTSKVARARGAYENIQTALSELDPARLTGPYDSLNYDSSFVERQLITSQLVGEFDFDDLEVDVRGSYSNSMRTSPYERVTQYRYFPTTGGYAPRLATPTGVNFSDLNEDVWSGGFDVAYELPTDFTVQLSAGYAYSDTSRSFESLNFVYDDAGTQVGAGPNAYQPIYVLLQQDFVDYEGIGVRQSNRAFGQSLYIGDLVIHGAYVRGDAELADGVRLEGGVRYETADQFLILPDVYNNNTAAPGQAAVIAKSNNYWLPAATVTWNFAEDFQLRAHGSKTIARPQFRELGTIPVLDVESDRLLSGNPFLTDSQLYNAEARVEYYPGRGERMSIAGFYKKIDSPIESIATVDPSGQLILTNANAPQANLYGVEAEVVKYFDLYDLGVEEGFFANQRLVLSANYTYSKSELRVQEGDTTTLFPGDINSPLVAPSSQVFIGGSPLTGQSEHLANLQFGIENTEKLQQITLLVTYASDRVVARGANTGGVVDPDIIESPGFNLDVIVREEVEIAGLPPLELKAEVRNILGRGHEEFQTFGSQRIEINTYDVGTTFAASVSVKL